MHRVKIEGAQVFSMLTAMRATIMSLLPTFTGVKSRVGTFGVWFKITKSPFNNYTYTCNAALLRGL